VVEHNVRHYAAWLLTLLFVTGCAGGNRSVPPVMTPVTGAPSGFKVPAKLSLPVPRHHRR